MPLTPTPGADATLAGMSLVNGATAGSAADLDEYVNRVCDYVANGPLYWKPGVIVSIAKGGTGAATAAGARTALGITPANLGAWQNSGAVSAGAAPTLGWDGSTLLAEVPGYAAPFQLARRSDLGSNTDITLSGHLYVPNSFAAVSGYTIAYINSDGRLSRGASSERYKKWISAIDPASLGDLFPPLNRYQMRTGDGAWRYGYIAERLAENPDTEPFVIYASKMTDDGPVPVYDDEGKRVAESIEFIGLLLAQVAQLDRRDRQREFELSQLHERIERLEAQIADR